MYKASDKTQHIRGKILIETIEQQLLSVIRVNLHLIHYNNEQLNLNQINSKPNYKDTEKQINIPFDINV